MEVRDAGIRKSKACSNKNHKNNTHHTSTKMGIKTEVEDRFELFLLGDGEKKCTEASDTRKLLPNLNSKVK